MICNFKQIHNDTYIPAPRVVHLHEVPITIQFLYPLHFWRDGSTWYHSPLPTPLYGSQLVKYLHLSVGGCRKWIFMNLHYPYFDGTGIHHDTPDSYNLRRWLSWRAVTLKMVPLLPAVSFWGLSPCTRRFGPLPWSTYMALVGHPQV